MKKIILCTFSFILFSGFSFSQNTQVVEWDHVYGGDQNDFLPHIIQTSDSGFILAGYSHTGINGDKTQPSWGDSDYWIIKIDKYGVKEWDKSYGGDSVDILRKAISTKDGGFLLGGYSYSGISGDKSEVCRGIYDIWIVKVDSSGNKQWEKTFGGTSADALQDMQQLNDGGYILGGSAYCIGGDHSQPGWSTSEFDMWVIRIDSIGNKKWDKRFGTTTRDDLLALKETSDGGFILAGESNGGIQQDKTTASNGFWDGWIVKIDSSGNKQWDNSFGGINYDKFSSVEVVDDGGFILGGNLADSLGNSGYWVLRTDSSGNKIWEQIYGGDYHEEFWNLSKTNDMGFLLMGYSQSPVSGTKTESNLDFTQAWLVKIDSGGQQQWDKTILNRLGPGADSDIPDAIQTMDGGYAVVVCTSGGISGEKTEASKGGFDYWLVKLTDKFNSISGNVFFDFNSNNMRDSSDVPSEYTRISSNQASRIAFTGSNGNYAFPVLDSGTFVVIPQNVNYYNSIPYSHTAYFSSIYQTDSLNDFAYQPTGIFNDLKITAEPLTRFRPGREAVYELTCTNLGTTTLSADVIFITDPNFSFVSSDIPTLYSSADSIVWNFPNFTPQQKRKIKITVDVVDTVATGTPLFPRGRIEPLTGDMAPGNNFLNWEIPVLITMSFDPNEKSVSKDSLYTNQIDTYLDYTIHFQNTGNDTAFFVKVLDNISPLLDMNTFEIVEVSHPMQIEYLSASRMLIFKFNNILLPDSNIDLVASNGYIHYRIKPISTIPVNSIIPNYAAIYFDFNLPVLTNTTTTSIILNNDLQEKGFVINDEILIYPNPATNQITIHSNSNIKGETIVSIKNTLGEILLQRTMELTGDLEINIADLPAGLYFLQLKSKNKNIVKRFVKEY